MFCKENLQLALSFVHDIDVMREICFASQFVETVEKPFPFPSTDIRSPFDTWVDSFPKGKYIGEDEQLKLACMLCGVDRDSLELGEGSSAFNEDTLVSWCGVEPEWFLGVFMKCPVVQEFLRYGCRMWLFALLG